MEIDDAKGIKLNWNGVTVENWPNYVQQNDFKLATQLHAAPYLFIYIWTRQGGDGEQTPSSSLSHSTVLTEMLGYKPFIQIDRNA